MKTLNPTGLAAVRQIVGVSQIEFAKNLGSSQPYISKIENTKKDIKVSRSLQMLRACGISKPRKSDDIGELLSKLAYLRMVQYNLSYPDAFRLVLRSRPDFIKPLLANRDDDHKYEKKKLSNMDPEAPPTPKKILSVPADYKPILAPEPELGEAPELPPPPGKRGRPKQKKRLVVRSIINDDDDFAKKEPAPEPEEKNSVCPKDSWGTPTKSFICLRCKHREQCMEVKNVKS